MSNGKGSDRRPCQVPREQFDANWDRVFGKAKTETRIATCDALKGQPCPQWCKVCP